MASGGGQLFTPRRRHRRVSGRWSPIKYQPESAKPRTWTVEPLAWILFAILSKLSITPIPPALKKKTIKQENNSVTVIIKSDLTDKRNTQAQEFVVNKSLFFWLTTGTSNHIATKSVCFVSAYACVFGENHTKLKQRLYSFRFRRLCFLVFHRNSSGFQAFNVWRKKIGYLFSWKNLNWLPPN